MVSSTRSVRLSNREPSVREADELVQWTNSSGERPKRQRRAGVLTIASHKLPPQRDSQLLVPLIPAKAGIQERLGALHGIEASRRNKPHGQPWIPAFAGMSGDGAVMRERVRPAS
jgi:hypothetical protein